MDKAKGFVRIAKRARWLVLTKACLGLLAIAFAASITVTTSTHQAEFGSVVEVTSGLTATDKGFSAATAGAGSNGANCTNAVSFGAAPAMANTNIVAGNLVYDVQVNSTSTTSTSTQYNVTLVLGSNSYGPLCIQTQAVQPADQTIDCKFDIGSNNLPASPYTFKVTVQ